MFKKLISNSPFKYVYNFYIGFFLSLFLFSSTFAAETDTKIIEPNTLVIADIIIKISGWILSFTGLIAILFIVYSGIQYITSAGNPDQIGNAKKTLTYAVIGLIVVILSYSIVKLTVNTFSANPGGILNNTNTTTTEVLN